MHHSSTVEVPAVKDLSRIAAENNPDKTAFGDGVDGETVTWREFDDRSNRAANAFRQYVGQGDRIAYLCENSLEHTILWNGGLKAGCTVSNLHIRASPNTLQHCIDSLRPKVLVVDESTSEIFDERLQDKITTDLDAVVNVGEPQTAYEEGMESFLEGRSETEPDVRVLEDDTAVVMWTSGTTGEPKGWCHTNRGLYFRANALVSVYDLHRTARQPHVFTPSFAAWYSVTLPALVSGATTYFLSSWDPEAYLRMIDEHDLTSALLVPTMWREVLNLDSFDEYDLSSLDGVMSAGEVLDATTLNRLRENVCDVVKNSYAATEAYATVMENAELTEERVESVGKPVPGVQVRIIEENGTYKDPKPPGEVGEIAVRAPDCPVWAWERTEKTEDVFEDGWWYSGDLGYKDEKGFIYLEGRTDLMIMSKGIKVYPSPIEERLNAHPDVNESAVVGVEDEEYGEKVTAYVYADDPDLTAEELDEWCLESDEIARMERPREYHFVDRSLPRTSTGKLDRLSARDQDLE
ncbi:class I adenylate-forming enzyme family protein [Halobellus clavatus]|jgi:acyl-coenzyme A synthetase/AMP-(fatty) acid ligase|uniref:Acyl-CoA synthetase (AMP-forming)/AMP-acid ligase II n=1 Tax=Halobellus clavatus TaxID=660517 RepID=A0A1H3FVY2_9EURY|nr:class I adenylate-forming enzyme family protein [Halobellus clavatus]SDX95136.1 Acyl-CoA synthetase (AMP-forming)/AMP-acid ligase II [Halobellus clavatus]